MTFFSWLVAFFRSRNDLGLELAALRHQLAVLRRKIPCHRLSLWDRLFWLTLRRLWPKWSSVLLIVKPETVASWHRAGAFLAVDRVGRRSPRSFENSSDPAPSLPMAEGRLTARPSIWSPSDPLRLLAQSKSCIRGAVNSPGIISSARQAATTRRPAKERSCCRKRLVFLSLPF